MENPRLVSVVVLATMVVLACQRAPSGAEVEVEATSPDVRPKEPYFLPPDSSAAVWFLGSLAEVKATVEETGAQWGAIVVTGAPGYSPAPHIHRREDESFYVLEGALRFTAGEHVFDANPGSFVFAPMGIPHGFEVTSEQPAKWLLIHGPTGDFHRFIREVGGEAVVPIWPARLPPPDPGTVREIALRHHIEPLAPTDAVIGR